MSLQVTSGVVKKGPIELVDYAMEFWLQEMKDGLSQQDLTQMRIRERVHTGIKTRLELEIPYLKVWP